MDGRYLALVESDHGFVMGLDAGWALGVLDIPLQLLSQLDDQLLIASNLALIRIDHRIMFIDNLLVLPYHGLIFLLVLAVPLVHVLVLLQDELQLVVQLYDVRLHGDQLMHIGIVHQILQVLFL